MQLSIAPPLGCIADSISAAVVPGAKLLPITRYGPGAVPRIFISPLSGPTLSWARGDAFSLGFDGVAFRRELLLTLRACRYSWRDLRTGFCGLLG